MSAIGGRLAVLVALLCCAGAVCSAADRPASPGYVDGRLFLELASADENDTLVEVNVPPPLIRAVSKAVDVGDPDLGRTLAGLRAVQAIVLKVQPARAQEALNKSRAVSADLRRQGWSPLARVCEKQTSVAVLVLVGPDEDAVEGLTVVGFDREERQIIFVNVAGTIKMSQLGKVMHKLELDDLHPWDAQTDRPDSQARGEP